MSADPLIGMDARFLLSRPASPHAEMFRQVLLDNARVRHPFRYRLFTWNRDHELGDLGAPNVTLNYVATPRTPLQDFIWVHVFLTHQLRRDPVDLFVSCYYKAPVLSAVPCVNMVHDLSFFRLPAEYLGGRHRTAWYRWLIRRLIRFHCLRARGTITVSQYSRRCLVELLNLSPSRVKVVYNPVDSDFYCAAAGAAGFPRKYFLFVGSDIPKKRLQLTLQAYAQLPRQLRQDYSLVLRTSLGATRIQEFNRLGLLDNVKIISAPVSHQGMVRLIQHACCVILLSADEGFGLPVAQAMAAGTPVLISAADALREIVGEAGAQAACENLDNVVREWTRVALDAGFRARLVREATARAEAFRRERIAHQFVSAMNDLALRAAVS